MGPTDRQTDRVGHRVACTRLKNWFRGIELAKATDVPRYGPMALLLWWTVYDVGFSLASRTDEIVFGLPQCANTTLHFACSYAWGTKCYSAMHKKRYKPKFMLKGLKINFLGSSWKHLKELQKTEILPPSLKCLINLFRFYDKTKIWYQKQQWKLCPFVAAIRKGMFLLKFT